MVAKGLTSKKVASKTIATKSSQTAVRRYGMDHSAMAMRAAKRMSRSKQKQKTGRVVCHHLRMMLVSGEAVAPIFIRPSISEVSDRQITLGF